MSLASIGGKVLGIGGRATSQVTSSRVGSIVKSGGSQSHVVAPYQCYLGMWGVFVPNNESMTFAVDMQVFPATFPAGTKINWNVTPDPDYSGINGYLTVAYGNYDDNAVTITSRKVNTITTMKLAVDWTFAGNAASGLLCECWLTPTTRPTGGTSGDAVAEVSFHPKMSSASQSYFNSLANVGSGSFTDSLGVTWNVKQDNIFYLAARPGFAEHRGVFDFKSYFAFLTAAGKLTGNEWFNGVAFGPEPKSGAGSVVINSFAPTYA